MFKIAMKYLSAPISSVESERHFKSAKNLTGGNRTRLLPENVHRLLFLKHNLSAVGFNSHLLDDKEDSECTSRQELLTESVYSDTYSDGFSSSSESEEEIQY